MSLLHLLEDFGQDLSEPSVQLSGKHADDGELLDTFEQGYKAGWEDAIRATQDEVSHVSSVLGRNLQELSFTYHEAYAAVIADVSPVLEAVSKTILPKVAQKALGGLLIEQLLELTRKYGEQTATIIVSPNEQETVSRLLPEALPFPVTVKSDPVLSAGQAQIDFRGREQHIDLDEALQSMTKAFEAFSFHSADQSSRGKRNDANPIPHLSS